MNREVYSYDEQKLVITEMDGILIAEWQKSPTKNRPDGR